MRCAVLDDYQGVVMSMADWSRLDGRVEVTGPSITSVSEDVVRRRARRLRPRRDHARADPVSGDADRAAAPAAAVDHVRPAQRLGRSRRRHAGSASPSAVRAAGKASTVELTWALILGLVRGVAVENAAFHAGRTVAEHDRDEPLGSTLGLVGLGQIGSQVAAVARAFGMDVLAGARTSPRNGPAAAGADSCRVTAGPDGRERRRVGAPGAERPHPRPGRRRRACSAAARPPT